MFSPHTSLPDFLAVRDGQLHVDGVPVSQLAARAGTTPFYVYSRTAIGARIAALRAALPPAIHLHYAIKANPMPALVSAIAPQVDGFDVASAGELLTALNAGMAAESVSFAGPGKTAAELRQAVAAGVRVHVESRREIALLAELQQSLGVGARVALRINPDFALKGAGMRMGGGARPFGIDAEAAPEALAQIGAAGLQFEGFHLFAGSQNLKSDAIIAAQQATLALIEQLAEAAPAPVRHCNLGGGFGIAYFPGETALDLAPIADNLAQLSERAARTLPQAQLVLELGRYLVGEAGVYVCRVLDRKTSRGTTYLVTDGGLHQHLAASGNFGQVIRKNYPVRIATRMASYAPTEEVSIVGPLCTPLDILADKMTLPVAAPDDLVAVLQSGAYGASASPQAFLGHPPVRELLL
ncbi:MAG: pyridoxal-dependent decarboxylase, exosortase A system-associated [Rhodocyclaceae bacterium]|nr:pyridoxal-dependent decarboxylase, exosortase A system-associated [Rhodocyclaceae bacterium]